MLRRALNQVIHGLPAGKPVEMTGKPVTGLYIIWLKMRVIWIRLVDFLYITKNPVEKELNDRVFVQCK